MKSHCEKCGAINIAWESGVRYEGLDEHHNPPRHMFEWIGELWKGNIFTLCRECHNGKNGIHNKIILPLLNKHAGFLKRYQSEFWICKRMSSNSVKNAREEIFIESNKWLINKNGNP